MRSKRLDIFELLYQHDNATKKLPKNLVIYIRGINIGSNDPKAKIVVDNGEFTELMIEGNVVLKEREIHEEEYFPFEG